MLYVQDLTKGKDGFYFFPAIAAVLLIELFLVIKCMYKGSVSAALKSCAGGMCYLGGSVRFSL